MTTARNPPVVTGELGPTGLLGKYLLLSRCGDGRIPAAVLKKNNLMRYTLFSNLTTYTIPA